MPSFSINLKYQTNLDTVLSPTEIRNTYLFGVNIKNQNGAEFSDDDVKTYVKAAQDEIEEYLQIRLRKQVIEESLNFIADDYINWGYIRTSYPVVCPVALQGFVNTVKQIDYPKEWLTAKTINDGKNYHRNLYVVPAGTQSATSLAVVYSGIIPQLGYLGNRVIPNYWRVKYVTGFDTIPSDILNAIGMIASINLFHIAGDLILGAGIASFSIGIDGLSQNIQTTSSATNAGYGARIINYTNELKKKLPDLRDYYQGFRFGVA